MDFSKKNIIIGSVLLLLALVVVFNLDMFTGEAGRALSSVSKSNAVTSAEVIPNRIKAGEYINVHITPGSKCTDKKISIYRAKDNRFVVSFERKEAALFGGYRFCRPVVASYRSWNSWHGNYYVLVRDLLTNKDVKVAFFVE